MPILLKIFKFGKRRISIHVCLNVHMSTNCVGRTDAFIRERDVYIFSEILSLVKSTLRTRKDQDCSRDSHLGSQKIVV